MERSLWEQLLWPLEWFVEWVLVAFHAGFTAIGMPAESGWTWVLSIAGLVVVIRTILIPLFVKQIQSSRRMQLIQPEMQKIQKKYKGRTDPDSRQAMSQETMDLYKRTGTNPLSSCMPILLQMPIFFALFRVLNGLKPVSEGLRSSAGPLGQELAAQAEKSDIFGASLSSTFLYSGELSAKIITVILIILMSLTTFMTQHQLMRKNMPPSALEGPFAQQQKMLLYILPAVFAISGVNFPIGVLMYWFTTNLWSLGQQFYVIRRMPAPGSPAERALEERRRKRGKVVKKLSVPGLGNTDDDDVTDVAEDGAGDGTNGSGGSGGSGGGSTRTEPRSGGQRKQPKRKKRKR